MINWKLCRKCENNKNDGCKDTCTSTETCVLASKFKNDNFPKEELDTLRRDAATQILLSSKCSGMEIPDESQKEIDTILKGVKEIKVFNLVDKETNRVESIFIPSQSNNKHFIDGTMLDVSTWDGTDGSPIDVNFVFSAYIKWDGCSHFNFYGEDHTNDSKEHDSYYHLCSFEYTAKFITQMMFIWELAVTHIDGIDVCSQDDLYNSYKDIIKVLDDYDIVESTVTEESNVELYHKIKNIVK